MVIPRAADSRHNGPMTSDATSGATSDSPSSDESIEHLDGGGIRRSAKMAALPVAYAGRTAWGFGKRIGGRPAAEVQAQLQARTAEQLFRVLGELKGGAMKVGQAMSVFEAALPEELMGPYRDVLTKLQNAAPPMPPEIVRQVMEAELGADWRERFSEFDETPTAAASIGQVHRARYRDGREVAVKVQYPGAAKALRADLKQAGRLARTFGALAPGVEMKPLIAELQARVEEELDYLAESKRQRAFAAAYEGDPQFVVPHILAASPRCLISEWVDGIGLSAIIREGTARQRNDAGALYLEFLLSGPARAGLLHADPHPGNFMLTADGKLAVIDFGACAFLPDGFPPAIGPLVSMAIREPDPETLVQGLRAEGFLKPSVSVDPPQITNYLMPFTEPLRHAEFHYSRSWLREQFLRVKDVRSSDFSTGLKFNLPPQYLLIHRVWLGSLGVLCQLDATVAARAIAQQWIPGFADDLPEAI